MMLAIRNPQSAIRNRRRGITLTEVLLAIFVMGIGMIALLVLFPLGMINMNQAIKDDRMAMLAHNAESLAEMPRVYPLSPFQVYTLRTDPILGAALREELTGQATSTPATPAPVSQNPFFVDPTDDTLAATGAARFDLNGLSPPIFVDPQGTALWPGGGPNPLVGKCVGVMPGPDNNKIAVQYWHVPTATGMTVHSYGIRRCAPTFAGSIAAVRRMFMGEDELTFDPNGQARVTGALVERSRRHSWAYMLRLPRSNETRVADLTIVMFQGRQVEGVSGFGAPPEPHFLGFNPTNALDGRAFVAGSTEVRLKVPLGTTLPAKRGDWLLDATVIPPNPIIPTGALTDRPALFNGYFYRIVGVGEVQPATATEGYQIVEISRPALADGYVGVMITGVSAVIEKSDGKMPPG